MSFSRVNAFFSSLPGDPGSLPRFTRTATSKMLKLAKTELAHQEAEGVVLNSGNVSPQDPSPEVSAKIDVIKRGHFVYVGETLNRKAHGRGVFFFANGDRYEGDSRDDMAHGKGVFLSANGVRYQGDWCEGKRHGKGKYFYKSGARYEGGWREDNKHGKGKYFHKEGTVFDGEWVDDKRHEWGIETIPNVGSYHVRFRNGARVA